MTSSLNQNSTPAEIDAIRGQLMSLASKLSAGDPDASRELTRCAKAITDHRREVRLSRSRSIEGGSTGAIQRLMAAVDRGLAMLAIEELKSDIQAWNAANPDPTNIYPQLQGGRIVGTQDVYSSWDGKSGDTSDWEITELPGLGEFAVEKSDMEECK